MLTSRTSKPPITAIILSGGKSLRMGKNKAFVEIEGTPIILRIHALLSQIFSEIIIVANEIERFVTLEAKIYRDLIPNSGALGGLYTGLFYSEFPHAFVVACDMPYLKKALIQWMIERIEDYDVVVPRTKGGLEPLHALYSKNCLKSIRSVLDQGKFKILDFYPLTRVKIIDHTEFLSLDPGLESFINVNTPEELSSLDKKERQPL